jgi:hypothetical protein
MNPKPDLLTQILAFLSSIARYIGLGIVRVIRLILPSVSTLDALAEPIGVLALLTIFVILSSAARKVALIILLAGWALILIRILLMAFRVG